MALIQLKNLFFNYHTDEDFSLNISHFSVATNSSLFVEGPSGCGKTTFLNLLTGLIKPIQGKIHILETDITQLNHVECDRFRADHFGIIFQLFNLIPYLSVRDNIILPCTFSSAKKNKALAISSSLKEEARRLCHDLDIDDTLMKKPIYQLSIGQQQRVAIARALIGQPEIIIADEPTSALDHDRKEQFMDLLLKECKKYKLGLIFVSHDMSLKSQFNQVYSLGQYTIPAMKCRHVSV